MRATCTRATRQQATRTGAALIVRMLPPLLIWLEICAGGGSDDEDDVNGQDEDENDQDDHENDQDDHEDDEVEDEDQDDL